MNGLQTAFRRRSKLSLTFVILLGLPAAGQAEDVGLTSYFFPADPEYLLVSVRRTWTEGPREAQRIRSRTFRVFAIPVMPRHKVSRCFRLSIEGVPPPK